MHSADTSPRRAAGRADSGRTISPDPIFLDRINQRTPQFAPVAADARMLARVWIVGAIVVLSLLFFVTARSWLPGLTTSARDDAPKPIPGASPSTSAVTTPSPQQPDNSRRVISTHSSSNLPVQKPTIAIVIPRGTPSNEQASDLPPQTEISPPLIVAPEPLVTVTTPQQLDLREIEDAKRVQQRLIDLGFLFGPADGVWGPRSRRALQEFRVANGIGDSDTWDEATQDRLLTASDANAASTSDISFIGGWGVDVAQCRESPLRITARQAEAFGTACEFHSTQRESSNVWRLRALCTNNSERWNANIRFTLSGSKLTWSSERGTTTYVRCPS